MAYEGMIAETISMNGDKNEPISAYAARPLGPGPFPGIVLIHHAPGWDEFTERRPAGSRITAIWRSATPLSPRRRRQSRRRRRQGARRGRRSDAQVIGDTEAR